MRAGSGTSGFPQPFAQPEKAMLEIQSGKVVISIVIMSVLRHSTGFEQIRRLVTVKRVQVSDGEGSRKAQKGDSSSVYRREFACSVCQKSFLDISF